MRDILQKHILIFYRLDHNRDGKPDHYGYYGPHYGGYRGPYGAYWW